MRSDEDINWKIVVSIITEKILIWVFGSAAISGLLYLGFSAFLGRKPLIIISFIALLIAVFVATHFHKKREKEKYPPDYKPSHIEGFLDEIVMCGGTFVFLWFYIQVL